jgi:hypothetical protein
MEAGGSGLYGGRRVRVIGRQEGQGYRVGGGSGFEGGLWKQGRVGGEL